MPFFGKSKKLASQTSDPGNNSIFNSSSSTIDSSSKFPTSSHVDDQQNRSLGTSTASHHHKYRFFGKKSSNSKKSIVQPTEITASTSHDQFSSNENRTTSSSRDEPNSLDESRFTNLSSKTESLKIESIPENVLVSPPKIPPKPERLTLKCELNRNGIDSTDQVVQKSADISTCKISPMFDLQSPLKSFTFSDLYTMPPSLDENSSPNRRILLKRHLLNRLVSRHDPKLSNFICNLQRYCRRLLARRKLNTLKKKHENVQIIQQALVDFVEIHRWPWCKLYEQILPLAKLKNSEEIKAKEEEIERLKVRLEKSENFITELKSQCQSLSNRLTQSERILDEEKQASIVIGESLENENKLRKQLEDALSKTRSHFDQLKSENQALDQRLANYESVLDTFDNHQHQNSNSPTLTSTENVDDDEDDRTERGGPVKIVEQRFSLIAGDFGQKMTENSDEDEDFKTAVESRMSATADTIRSKIVRLKMRAAQLAGEKGNFDKILAEKELKINELTNINEKLNVDLSDHLNQVQILSQFKQKFEQEKNVSERLRSEIEKLRSETTKVDNQNSGNEELESLRSKCRDLERKCACQQSELDDNVEEMENLRLKITRLEISNQKLKSEEEKDLRRRDEEIDEIRIPLKKKIQNLEQQLEDEEKQKSRYQKQVKQLESELRDFRTNAVPISPTESEKYQNLKKTFVKTKFLLNDAQKYLEHFQKTAPNRCALVQLKNQLEESENGRLFSIRQKQILETDLAEMKDELENLSKEKKNVDERLTILNREKSRLEILTRDQELQIKDLSKKFQKLYGQYCTDLAGSDRNPIKSNQMNGQISQKLENSNSKTSVIEDRIRDLEAKFEVEHAEKIKAEAFCRRLQHELDSLQENSTFLKAARQKDQETLEDYKKRLSRSRDEILQQQQRCADAEQKIAHLTDEIKRTEEENVVLKSDYDFTSQRLENLKSNLNLDQENHHHHHHRRLKNMNQSSVVKNHHHPQDSPIEEDEDEDDFSDLEAEIANFASKNGRS